jgi:hypothetical protein
VGAGHLGRLFHCDLPHSHHVQEVPYWLELPGAGRALQPRPDPVSVVLVMVVILSLSEGEGAVASGRLLATGM